MKKILSIVACALAVQAYAQKPVITQANIEKVKVYNNAAELTHKTKASIPAGSSEMVITNVANYLTENTIQIQVPKGVTVMSVQFTNTYVEEYDNAIDSPISKSVKEQISSKELELKTLQNQLTSERKSVELLDKNQSMSNAQNFSVAELTKLLEYYKSKRTEISNNIYQLEKKEIVLQQDLTALKGKLSFNETTSQKTSNGKIVVHLMSKQAGEIPLKVSYLTNQANWQPGYELRIDKINQPIQMLYKAQLVQNTGVDWKNVKLSLTSSVANQSTQVPELFPWFMGYFEEEIMVDAYRSESRDVIGRANSSVLKSISGLAPGINVETSDDSPIMEQSNINDYVQLNQNQLNVTFDIDIPYTILSNGKQHSVTLKETQLPATYHYISIPKIDTDVYLIAKIKDYGAYNLLSGYANVVFEDVYIGKTYINANANSDELQLSLGKDQNISVKRELIKDKSETKTLSSRKQQDFVYEITARNNKKENITITIEDNVPIASVKDIEVALLDKDGANFDEEKGKLKWDVLVKSNESKKIRFVYQVKYAKDKVVNFY